MAPGDEKKKKKRRRRKKKMDDDDFMIESANVAKKLHEKYGSKKVRFFIILQIITITTSGSKRW